MVILGVRLEIFVPCSRLRLTKNYQPTRTQIGNQLCKHEARLLLFFVLCCKSRERGVRDTDGVT